jgi:hypothetical protein
LQENMSGWAPAWSCPALLRAISHRRLAAFRKKLALTDDQVSTGSRVPEPAKAKIYSVSVQSMVKTLGPILSLTDENQIGKIEMCIPSQSFDLKSF